MRLKDLYDYAVKFGLDRDPRSRREIADALKGRRKEYNKLPANLKRIYDKDRLVHPYDDTRILYGDPSSDVKKVMVGIDMEVGELVLADRLRSEGRGVDLVIAHHPEGYALAGFYRVMDMQADMLKHLGVTYDVAKELLKERMGEVARSISAVNHTRSVDAARLLDIPYMCMHTPADNHVMSFLQERVDKKRPKTLKELMNVLLNVPEYKDAAGKNAGPYILIGKEKDKAGKMAVDMTGGTEGSKRVFPRLSQAGVNTLICMHLSENHYKSAQKEHINIVIAGHISSDTVGLNLILDRLCRKENLEVVPCSGFVRVKRG